MQSENISNNTNFDNDEISLKELIFKIREWYLFFLTKWKLIILVSALGGAIGLSYAFFQKPIYKAELTFAMEDEKTGGGGGLSGALGLASSFGIDLLHPLMPPLGAMTIKNSLVPLDHHRDLTTCSFS